MNRNGFRNSYKLFALWKLLLQTHKFLHSMDNSTQHREFRITDTENHSMKATPTSDHFQKCPSLSTSMKSTAFYFFPGPLYSAHFHGDSLSSPSWLLSEIPVNISRLTLDSGNYYQQMLLMLMIQLQRCCCGEIAHLRETRTAGLRKCCWITLSRQRGAQAVSSWSAHICRGQESSPVILL